MKIGTSEVLVGRYSSSIFFILLASPALGRRSLALDSLALPKLNTYKIYLHKHIHRLIMSTMNEDTITKYKYYLMTYRQSPTAQNAAPLADLFANGEMKPGCTLEQFMLLFWAGAASARSPKNYATAMIAVADRIGVPLERATKDEINKWSAERCKALSVKSGGDKGKRLKPGVHCYLRFEREVTCMVCNCDLYRKLCVLDVALNGNVEYYCHGCAVARLPRTALIRNKFFRQAEKKFEIDADALMPLEARNREHKKKARGGGERPEITEDDHAELQRVLAANAKRKVDSAH